MRFDVWKWLVKKDDLILSLIEIAWSSLHFFGFRDWKWRRIGNRIIEEDARMVKGSDVVIVLNGPSIKRQPLERLKGKDLIFVNQGFRLAAYQDLRPKYHVFIDTKLIHGVWDIEWLNEIHSMVPDITFVLPASWARLPLLKPYIERGYRIIWVGGCIGGMRGLGVSGACFDLAKALGYSTIYFTGFEATSFAASVLKVSSHFYGNDADECAMTPGDIMKGYYMNARQIRELILVAEHFKKSHVRVCNLTQGGVLNMFQRKEFEEVFPA